MAQKSSHMLSVTNDSANRQEDSNIWVLHVQGKQDDLIDAAVSGPDYVFQRRAEPGRRVGAAFSRFASRPTPVI
jgi:hypothetical protein